jgi:serine phosphatase RsbU (regulator of sigma subunit)
MLVIGLIGRPVVRIGRDGPDREPSVSITGNISLDRTRRRQEELLRRRQDLAGGMSLLAIRQADPVDVTDTDLHLAGQIQRQFQPRSFQLCGGFEVGSAVLPYGTVCGDIVDVTTFGRHYLSVWLADATGHGVAAAMLAAHLQPQLRRVAWDGRRHRPRRPDRALALLNRVLLAHQPGEPVFVAAVCCLADLRSGRVMLSRGGAPVPMLVRGDAAVEPVLCAGQLVGIEPAARFESAHLELQSGESLVFWSDGLERLVDREQAVGAAGQAPSGLDFEAIRDGRVAEALDRLRYRWWRARTGSVCEDDTSVIVLRRR